jgi:hypothetical protein
MRIRSASTLRSWLRHDALLDDPDVRGPDGVLFHLVEALVTVYGWSAIDEFWKALADASSTWSTIS